MKLGRCGCQIEVKFDDDQKRVWLVGVKSQWNPLDDPRAATLNHALASASLRPTGIVESPAKAVIERGGPSKATRR